MKSEEVGGAGWRNDKALSVSYADSSRKGSSKCCFVLRFTHGVGAFERSPRGGRMIKKFGRFTNRFCAWIYRIFDCFTFSLSRLRRQLPHGGSHIKCKLLSGQGATEFSDNRGYGEQEKFSTIAVKRAALAVLLVLFLTARKVRVCFLFGIFFFLRKEKVHRKGVRI